MTESSRVPHYITIVVGLNCHPPLSLDVTLLVIQYCPTLNVIQVMDFHLVYVCEKDRHRINERMIFSFIFFFLL